MSDKKIKSLSIFIVFLILLITVLFPVDVGNLVVIFFGIVFSITCISIWMKRLRIL